MKADPREYVRNSWRHPNDPTRRYDFRTTDGQKELDYLLNDASPLNPEHWGGINILLMGRGLLKTTTLQMIVSWAIQFYGPKGFEAYMGAPREDQYEEFTEKLRTKIEWAGLDDYRQKNAASHQKFKFEVDGRPVYSHFKADSGWGGGDAMRGPHSHLGIYDEFQDADKRSFNAGFYEVIDQSIAGVPYFPVIFIMGTPKMEGSFFNEMWERSDKREWRPDLGDDGAWLQTDDPDTYGTGSDAVEVHGWHIDQPTAPLHTEADIKAKRDLKDEQEFHNEVLARFYSPEDHLLSERHIDNVANPEMGFVRERRSEDNWVTIGVDWGGGTDRKAADTVIVVMEHESFEDGVTQSVVDRVTFIPEDWSKDDEYQKLEEQILRFDPDRIIVDEGYGSKRREDLQEGNYTMDSTGYDEVVGCRYGNVSDVDKVKWKDTDDKNLFTADKTHMSKSFVDFVKSGRLTLPAADIDTGAHGQDDATGTRIYRQLTAPYEEKKDMPSGRRKTRIATDSTQNDDAFHAFIYAWMGYHVDKVGPSNTMVRFNTQSAPGFG
ncbi:hypothetical protein PN419_00375 [Halorubrum ezzemoulense]|uniref:hypothetical protein n=1 Tax=Halorubrum ezzemoulense TaxID=337243 RepID=UPI0023313F38|nr:hypothetical protein [Halorubrum ezzemoulense]MDB9247462.1 hypothetical protein [Halorubrum ezzemoulense]MDB9258629.1 hypothetical protein [Halorubrum ezzemoulense]MDB9264513.1 hypothetical protein [Halorubrum ezzemoulense]MDB9268990.1 hypothetical protein [Halorubrum ezzemoulense]MDB9271481.1 hypothetical protein [Halorubrum ezzemoulense]